MCFVLYCFEPVRKITISRKLVQKITISRKMLCFVLNYAFWLHFHGVVYLCDVA